MAKKTRRERRFGTEKQTPFTPKAALAESPLGEATSAVATEEFTPALPKVAEAVPVNNRKVAAINLAQEYYYEYKELTTILIITGILFVVMIGLSFAI